MREKAILLIDFKFQIMSEMVLKNNAIAAERALDSLRGVLDMTRWLGLISPAEREYVFSAALAALYR